MLILLMLLCVHLSAVFTNILIVQFRNNLTYLLGEDGECRTHLRLLLGSRWSLVSSESKTLKININSHCHNQVL